MLQIKAKLIKNIEVTKNYYKIIISCPRLARLAQPGQFLQVKVSDSGEPLLRRPLSIHRVPQRPSVPASQLEILYEVVGKATEILAQKKAGEYLDIIGPLGNGFDYSAPVLQCPSAPVLVAGGMGVAPLFFLAEKLISHQSYQSHRLVVLMGAKTKSQILCEKEFKQLGCEVKIATDGGSRGFKGKVTDLLKEILATGHRPQVKNMRPAACDLRHATIYACGPRPMLKEISRISKQYHIPAQISLEEHMACGIGACLGCVVKTKEDYKRVCEEGPVFNADEIVWE